MSKNHKTILAFVLIALPLALWFGSAKMLPLLMLLTALCAARLMEFGGAPLLSRRPGEAFIVGCTLLCLAGSAHGQSLARPRIAVGSPIQRCQSDGTVALHDIRHLTVLRVHNAHIPQIRAQQPQVQRLQFRRVDILSTVDHQDALQPKAQHL